MTCDQVDSIPLLPERRPDSHKGDYGRALLVGGSRGMTGAIALAGMATLRSGAGLVTLAVPDMCLATVAAHEPCYMTVPLPCDEAGRFTATAGPRLCTLASRATAGAIGPGMGQSELLDELVGELYTRLPIPLVVDADALNALARQPQKIGSPGGPRILTPHPGEFDRLVASTPSDATDRPARAVQMARQHNLVIVLKGHRTLVTDGARSYHNATGNPGMATGGSGDVLTGVITALLCQGLAPWDAARLGVYVHGLAGDCAATRYSQVAMTAADMVSALREAWRQMS